MNHHSLSQGHQAIKWGNVKDMCVDVYDSRDETFISKQFYWNWRRLSKILDFQGPCWNIPITEKWMAVALQSKFPMELSVWILVSGRWRVKNVRISQTHTHTLTHTQLFISPVSMNSRCVFFRQKYLTHYHLHIHVKFRFIYFSGLYYH